MPFIIPQILVQDPCCKFNDCLKILNQKYEEAKCDGCLESDYAQEKKNLDRYIELEKLIKLSADCGDDIFAQSYALEQESICTGFQNPVVIYGCTDSSSTAYNPNATHPCTVDGIINGCCKEIGQEGDTVGCTDPTALNYDFEAVDDDGSCLYFTSGCTDTQASNYNPDAQTDDGSCFYRGCMDEEACNYDPIATVSGQCCYEVACPPEEFFNCANCSCEPCPPATIGQSANAEFDASGIHRCCPGGDAYPCDPILNA
tara:strand:+ start:500 stop:1273 length:774 start_codon:yes stop_codon:yes gene_type:complete